MYWVGSGGAKVSSRRVHERVRGDRGTLQRSINEYASSTHTIHFVSHLEVVRGYQEFGGESSFDISRFLLLPC